jgi:5-methylthioadenosine/S-adenosylhomocysteine deaminase
MTSVETVIEARWVLPVEPACVLEHHAVVVDDGRIVAVVPISVAREQFVARQRLALDRHVLLPGLVNVHTHAAMSLLRGLADDLPLMTWLKEHIWPVEMREVSAAFVHDGTLLACAEMLRGGITTFNDMYFFPEAAAQAAGTAGIRAALGMIVVDFPSPYAADPLDYLAKGMALRDAMREQPLLSFCFAPHAPYSVADKSLAQVATYANELDVPVHMHVHETLDEIEQAVASGGRRPLSRLESLGLLTPNLIAVHAVHLERTEIDALARNGCHVAHCPSSNMKLASGIAPAAALLAAGVNVALGTDGAASNNRLDLFQEMRQAALLAKVSTNDPTALPASQVLHMATLGGARALALDRSIGSLVAGKAADVIALDFGRPELTPCYDPVSHLVYAADRHDVSHVWVAGELLVEEGVLTRVEARTAATRAHVWQQKIAAGDAPARSSPR